MELVVVGKIPVEAADFFRTLRVCESERSGALYMTVAVTIREKGRRGVRR